ncbi:hypothetical protein TNCV_2320791 [Trichonephila clavipes]|nr:hypothetical protein TNCV_2320791 [Trichonephila clavipes]
MATPGSSFTPTLLGHEDNLETESWLEPDEIGNEIEEVVNLARQIIIEVDNDDDQELLDSHNQVLAVNEPIEIHE